VLDSLRFGEPAGSERSRYLLERAVAGIGHYGNSVGVPTVGGEIYFEQSYEQNCLVNAMCLGLAPHTRLTVSAAAGPGNVLMLLGALTGRDGIGGASVLASAELGEGDEAKRPSVQIGDPFTEKKLLEACLELLDRDLLISLQDLGAAGLTSSVAEMASKGGVGIDVDVARVPLREPGMEPFEVMISESQERMLCVVEPEQVASVMDVCERWEVTATPIGSVTGERRVRVLGRGTVVADLPTHVLVDDCPLYDLNPARWEGGSGAVGEVRVGSGGRSGAGDEGRGGSGGGSGADGEGTDAVSVGGSAVGEATDADGEGAPPLYPPPKAVLSGAESPAETLLALLRSANIASRKPVFEQYDPVVQSRTVRRPGEADAAVLALEDGSAIAVAIDGNGRRVACDPRAGAAEAVYECAANLACVGAEPLGLTNCLNFGNPEKPHVAWQLTEAVEGLAEACEALQIPVVGGNVSLYNESPDGPIFPTPVVGIVGKLPDATRAPGLAFAQAGDVIALVGRFEPSHTGSELAKLRGEAPSGPLPPKDKQAVRDARVTVRDAVRAGALHSAHDISEGGLAVAVAECCIAGGIGARVNAPIAQVAGGIGSRVDAPVAPAAGGIGARVDAPVPPVAGGIAARTDAPVDLFAEAPGCAYVVSGPEEAIPGTVIGRVGGDTLEIEGLLKLAVSELADAHAATLAALV
jgi:phosphoribosylformylglycinamidine synthase